MGYALVFSCLAAPLAAQGGSIRGSVKDSAGAALANASITVEGINLRATSGTQGDYELRGVPVRVELGPKDIEKGQAVLVRRDTGEKEFVERKRLAPRLHELMAEIQENMLRQATQFHDANTRHAASYDEFKEIIEEKRGFVVAPWDGTEETEQRIKEETKATIRLLPFDREESKDLVSGKPGETAIFARAY